MNSAIRIPVKAEDIRPEDDDIDEEAYVAMLSVFEDFINGIGSEITIDDLIRELASLRADFGFKSALKGFETDYDSAVELLNSEVEELTEEQVKRRNVIIAALENIIDFAVAEEYQMIADVEDCAGEIEWGIGLEGDELENSLELFRKYNYIYSIVENGDIEHAMHIALGLYMLSESAIITYRTQLDDRVRPWHLVYEGYSAPRYAFPEWLIPPIEHGCRCFIEEESALGSMNVKAASEHRPEMPEWFNRTFKESVANGGRIFSDEHPYFSVKKDDVERLQTIAGIIKKGYFNG